MMSRPISLIILGVVAVVMLTGTFVLLVQGREVPGFVIALDTAAITYLYGHGTFLAQNAAHTATIGDLLDAVNTGAKAATNGTTSEGVKK